MDPRKLPQVMVSTAQQRGLDAVLRTITDGIAQCPNTVLTRIWLATPNHLCEVCRDLDDASDQSRWLHLVASAGVPRDPRADYGRLDGAFHRFPMGERKIGRVAATGEPLRLAGLRGDEEWIADPAWFAHEGARTFAAQPLIFRDNVLGVLALFDRGLLNEEAFEWLRIFADYAAVSIANARAFDEISLLRTRLEEENLYLREEVTALETVSDLGKLELLALALPERVGSPLSLNALREDLQVSQPTVARWVDILERVYGIFRIAPFGAPRLRAVKKAMKHYHYDWSVVAAPGPRFENLVASHLLKWVEYQRDTQGRALELRYFRDIDGREADFVVVEGAGRAIAAVECKLGDDAVTPGLRYLKERVPDLIAWQVSATGRRDFLSPEGVRVAPAATLLRELV